MTQGKKKKKRIQAPINQILVKECYVLDHLLWLWKGTLEHLKTEEAHEM